MCGICGKTGLGGTESVTAMVHAMQHRGPDYSGITEFSCATLGMTRLSVQDTSDAGNQPMHSSDGLVTIVYNGETYNVIELRNWLKKKGYIFSSRSDTEVLLNLYMELGDDFLKKLRGMFALAVLDCRGGPSREKLLLARDPFGIKPLLYAECGGEIIFASEIKALLASGFISREINAESLRLLVTFGSVPQPKTMVSGVYMLQPGCKLVWHAGRFCISHYFSFAALKPQKIKLQYSEQVQVVQEMLQKILNLQMISDVPIGAFLSGGVDSSLLCALMVKSGRKKINTFSVGFEQEGEHLDESRDAFETATHLGTRHHHLIVRGQDVADKILDIARALDQPSVDGVNTYFVSCETRKHVTVALSGTGGDEIFAGYPWFGQMKRWAAQNQSSHKFIASLMNLSVLNPLASGRLGPWLEKRRINANFLSRYAMCHYIFGPTGAAQLLSKDIRCKTRCGQAMCMDIMNQDVFSQADSLCRVSGLCLRGYTLNQLLRDIDATSMFHSLEVRVPYLDPELLKVSLALPESTKLAVLPNGKIPQTYQTGLKRILYDIAKPFLPENFGNRAKRGFGMPFDYWLKGPLRDVFNDCLNNTTVTSAGLFDPKAVYSIKRKFESGQIMWMKPWLLMMTELWRREILNNG